MPKAGPRGLSDEGALKFGEPQGAAEQEPTQTSASRILPENQHEVGSHHNDRDDQIPPRPQFRNVDNAFSTAAERE